MSASGVADGLTIDIRSKRFPPLRDAAERHVIEGLRLALPKGSFTALVGPSGCGKTTALNIVAGLDRAYEGSVRLPDDGMVAYVFQEPRLLPWRSVESNIFLALDAAGMASDAWLDEILREVGLEDVRGVYASRLSLGMARRVALARAFAIRPTVLLMDEPFVSLDAPTARRLRRLLIRLLARHPATVLFVTHDLREAIELADQVAILTPPPTRLLEMIKVDLDAEERLDEARVERIRRELVGRAGLSGLL
ncbi:ABC transporter ATP-binding protein [Marinivivus vitaminiproducens]|uniref:ABC transporter ATP-binding protein n=1 Tax=Marinivivus vitaminiproducens TaxID=3035935 RepID=UPI0027A7AF26|nr:ABC transporter ATP-binding protein [Geminicoccaceae bacterium SCSIO 64248]